MPLPISTSLLLAAISLSIAGLNQTVVIVVAALAVANEALRFLALRSITGQPEAPGEYHIPAEPRRQVQGDDGG